MTKSEARKILDIMATVDDTCYYCVAKLFLLFSRHFPEYKTLAQEVYFEITNLDLDAVNAALKEDEKEKFNLVYQ